MEEYTLILYPENKDDLRLPLKPLAALGIQDAPEALVYADTAYEIELQCPDSVEITKVEFRINDYKADAFQKDNRFVFADKWVFRQYFGCVRLAVIISTPDDIKRLTTGALNVMVRKGQQNDAVCRMADYVYDNCAEVLFSGGSTLYPFDPDENNLYARLLLYQRIALLYEESYRFFKTNSRFQMVQKERVDRFEKLHTIKSSTMQYIAQHPNELRQVAHRTGISYGRKSYEPLSTLLSTNVYSFDIYENQVVVGFLETVVCSVREEERRALAMLESASKVAKETRDYVSSSLFMFGRTMRALESHYRELSRLSQQFEALVGFYKGVLPVKELKVAAPPCPTPVFISVPQYRKIFNAIVKWFEFDVYEMEREEYLLSFRRVSELYECYVLIKLFRYLSGAYEHTGSGGRGSARGINNVFTFRGKEGSITLYFQPVLYAGSDYRHREFGLYRNTSISVPDETDTGKKEREGRYYTPDYIVKIERAEGAQYVILDAKYSTIATVTAYDLVPLTYKYLFSLTPFSPQDTIAGLCVINGLSENQGSFVTDVYNTRPKECAITPFADILTLTENSPDGDAEHRRLIGQLFEKYMSV